MKKTIYLIGLVFFSLQLHACQKEIYQDSLEEININTLMINRKLKITFGNKAASSVLYDNQASRDLAEKLPLKINLTGFNKREKIANLPTKLSTIDEPTGFNPSARDITYYEPWGNIAIFYKDFSYSAGLVSLGKITSGIELLMLTAQ